MGHDLELFKASFPNVPGDLVLQDRKEVIDSLGPGSHSFQPAVHDFFTEQPVKGKRSPE